MHFLSLFPAYQEYWNPILMLYLFITGSVESVIEAKGEIFSRPEASRSQDSEKKSCTSIRFTVKLPELGLRAGLGWHELPWVTSHAHRMSQDYCKANEIQLSLWWKAVSWSAHPGLQHIHSDSCPSSAAALGPAMAWQSQGEWELLRTQSPSKQTVP